MEEELDPIIPGADDEDPELDARIRRELEMQVYEEVQAERYLQHLGSIIKRITKYDR